MNKTKIDELVLTEPEMVEVMWNWQDSMPNPMPEITQAMRFEVIAEAQIKKLERLGMLRQELPASGKPDTEEVRERLACIEHEQWMRWAKAILPELKELTRHHLPYNEPTEAGNCACKTCQRIKRWEQECFKPYSELTEEMKEYDRKETIPILSDPDILVKDKDQSLPENPFIPLKDTDDDNYWARHGYHKGQKSMAGFVRVLPREVDCGK